MDPELMAQLAPQPVNLAPAPRLGHVLWRFALLAALSLAGIASAEAQIIIGGGRSPSVTVDNSVLDRLGPAPTLPQLFGARPDAASRTPQIAAPRTSTVQTATVSLHKPAVKTASAKKKRTTRVAHKSTKKRTRVARAPAAPPAPTRQLAAASTSQVIHLIPPSAQKASAPRIASEQPAPAPVLRPAVAAVSSPPPPSPALPVLPKDEPAPVAPVIAAAPPHEAPPRPVAQPTATEEPPPAPARLDNPPVSLVAAQTDKVPAPPQTMRDSGAAVTPPVVQRPAPVQVAAIAGIGSALNSVRFTPGATDLPPSSQAILDTVAAKLIANDALRVQLIAHATGSADQAMEARRVSLARAVAVRAYLIDKGVRSLRMDVRALGNRADDGPTSDQVDLLLITQ
jgi:outer membrane protein OmpA-like peptidoglycan-associated protein